MWEQGLVSSYSFFVFSYVFVFFSLTFSVPLFRWLENDGCCVCFFVFLYFLSLVPLCRAIVEKLLCLLCKAISKVSYLIVILWISLEKGVF